jgi:hypothetical protein
MDFIDQHYAFNRGLVSKYALARVDLKRLALSASTFLNWMPRTLGSMMLRPGLQYLSSTRNDSASLHIDFVFGTSDTALIELTDSAMRVRVNDVIVTRPAVTSKWNRWDSGTSAFIASTDTAATFVDATDVGYWKDNDESGAVSTFATGGYLSLTGTGFNYAIRDRSIAVAGANIGVEHALTIVVARGAAMLRLGSTEGGDEYLEDRLLRTGTHSIAITPAGSFFVRLSNSTHNATLVDSVTLNQAAGDMVVPTPWLETDLDRVRWDNSGDVIFVACKGRAQKRIERQDRTSTPPSRSWSVVEYAPEDGPFGDINVGPVQLKSSGIDGDVDMTASKPFWKPGHVGALFRLTSAGQTVEEQIVGENVFTGPIKVTGVGGSRAMTIELSGPTFTGTTTVTLQRSVATPGSWTDQTSYTAPQTVTFNDLLDNQIIYYRIGVKTGDYTIGDDILARLVFSAGSIDGVARINGITSTTVATASVLRDFGAADQYTQDWYQGDWSPRRGYPSSVALFDGRLFWAGKNNIWGSSSDLLDSFDDSVEGDGATIKRSIGAGPVDNVNWLLALNNLVLGDEGAARVAKASSIDQPLTPTAFSLKAIAELGTAPVRALKVDTNGVYIGRNGSRIFQLSADASMYSIVPYTPTDLTAIVPEIGVPAFTRCAIQRFKDTRLHFVRGDGRVAILVFDKAEKVECWLLVETDGFVEDVVVLPGAPGAPVEDQVYYTVRRTINGVTKRFVEKWALESQAVCAADNRIADSFVTGTGTASTTLAVAHLEGETVCLWGNGKDLGTYVVSGGQITASEAITGPWCAGLVYQADWLSTKLTSGSRGGVPLTQYKTIDRMGLIAADMHPLALEYGMDFDHLDRLPSTEGGVPVDPDSIWADYDATSFALDGGWETDARLALRATAPRGVTVCAVVISGEGHDRS